MSINKFVNPGFFLSLDLLAVSLINWIYWLVISTLTSATEVGEATSVYSFVTLISAFTMLGLEYSLVKKSSSLRSHILGTSVIMELILTTCFIPLLLYFVNNLYGGTLSSLAFIAIGLLIFGSQRYIMRFTLLGNRDAISVLRINLAGAVSQLILGYILVYMGFGAAGILISFLLHFVLVTSLSFTIARRSFELNLDLKSAKEVMKDALLNTPNSLSKTIIFTLSVVLLASIGINQADVGTYYIALMVSIIAGGFAGNIAFMAIPASTISKKDLTLESTRLGLSATAPFIVALMTAPASILSLIGPEYATAAPVLLVLSIAIIPYIIVINAISKFNNLGQTKRIVSIGTIQLCVFLFMFFFLVPTYGTLGAAMSILIASIISSIPSIIWSESKLMGYVTKACVSIVAGLAVGYLVGFWFVAISPVVVIATSVSVTLFLVFMLKITSTNEILLMVTDIMKTKYRKV